MLFNLKAKGRHGTHSPFVYSFVENVLRATEQYDYCPDFLQQNEWNLLNRTLKCINPEECKVMGIPIDSIKESLSQQKWNFSTWEKADETKNHNQLFILTNMEHVLGKEKLLNQIAMNCQQLSVYILRPYDAISRSAFSEYYSSLSLKFTLDFWEGALLVSNKAFKEKQYFRLK